MACTRNCSRKTVESLAKRAYRNFKTTLYACSLSLRVNDIPAEFLVCEADEGDTSIDLLMAQMLQMEFDKEADKMLKREQDNYNRNSKDRRGDGQSAEQKRRQQIKSGFELLAELIPTIPTNTTSKTSKANVLVKTIEFITKLDDEKGEMEKEMDVLSQEIEALNDAITQCQSKLPATGLPAVSQQKEHLDQMLQVYIQDQTARDWRFYVFSKLVSPLFESYCKTVSTANTDELGRTSQAWLDQHCDLSNLRPVVVKSLQQLCSETSILTDPALFPEEAQGSAAPPAYNQRPKPEKTWQFG